MNLLERLQYQVFKSYLKNHPETSSNFYHYYSSKNRMKKGSMLTVNEPPSSILSLLSPAATHLPRYDVRGGLGGTSKDPSILPGKNGTDGTVYSSLSPCQPGYGSVFCVICPEGTYQVFAQLCPFILSSQRMEPICVYPAQMLLRMESTRTWVSPHSSVLIAVLMVSSSPTAWHHLIRSSKRLVRLFLVLEPS